MSSDNENILDGKASCPPRLWWVLEKKDEILALHSSEEYSPRFPMDCAGCKLFFQHCMYSNSERKSGNPICRWCQTLCERIQADQFDIHNHIHCNTLGKKRCGYWQTMEPPPPLTPVVKKEIGLADVAPQPEITFVVNKKMSQKERKAAARAQKEGN